MLSSTYVPAGDSALVLDYAFSGDSHRIVCRGRWRAVVCRCHGSRTRPGVWVTAVVIAAAGFTGLSWAVSADASATQGAGPAVVQSP